MDSTAQNQNNNVQFSYPNISPNNAQGQSVTPPAPTQPQVEDPKLAELRKSLNELIAKDTKAVTNPASYTVTPQPLPVFNGEPEAPSAEDISKIVKDTEPVNITTTLPPVTPSTLENIMPDAPKPKALERDPKIDNLSAPLRSADVKEDFLVKQVAPQIQPLTQSQPSIAAGGDLSIDALLTEAVNRNASDLHISVGYPVVIRIDGELQDLGEKILNPEDVESLVFSVLSDEKKELLEVNREIDFAYTHTGNQKARFRVNAYYSMKNLSAAFRLIPSRIRTLEELMLPQIYHQFAKLKQGLILVTGPTGHGKSTTLAAILEDINRTRFSHIVTIEDPIEYVFEGKKSLIDQREMNDDTHSWSIALRSALRQDPDVILVGEMRDYETIAAAITLAETGHLVFATLHTNSAAQTIDRIIDVFPENQQQQVRSQIATSLEAVVAQRLIPLEKGGRRAVSEVMINNAAIANLIREGKTYQIDNVIRTSSDVGMMYLEKSLVGLVREGVISVQKAQEYAVHPEEVLRLLKS